MQIEVFGNILHTRSYKPFRINYTLLPKLTSIFVLFRSYFQMYFHVLAITFSHMSYVWWIHFVKDWPNQLILQFLTLKNLDKFIKTPCGICIVLKIIWVKICILKQQKGGVRPTVGVECLDFPWIGHTEPSACLERLVGFSFYSLSHVFKVV
jgi:hypothetical protein